MKVKISTISTHKSDTHGYVKVLRSEFLMKKWKVVKITISTISTHKSNTHGYEKGLRSEF